MSPFGLKALHDFVVRAKQATYVGGGRALLPYRLGSHDLQFCEADWSYHDSYFGGSDFLGQEIVYWQGQAVWGMNYFGRILQPDHITAAQAGQVIKHCLSRLYQHGRFLGGYTDALSDFGYIDTNDGDVSHFQGKERIERSGQELYCLLYHGGLIQD